MPYADATNGITAGGAAVGHGWAAPDAETQAAVDFIFYLINTENIKTWHKAMAIPRCGRAIDELEAEGWFEENPAYFILLQQLRTRRPTR